MTDQGGKRGCLKWAVGCAAAAIIVVVAGMAMTLLSPGLRVKGLSRTIAPGMSVGEVVDRTQGWLSCRAYAGPPEKPVRSFAVTLRELEANGEPVRQFSSSGEMAEALARDMKAHGLPWTMTFGYSSSGIRNYFDVHFSPDGRVERVSETRSGRLD